MVDAGRSFGCDASCVLKPETFQKKSSGVYSRNRVLNKVRRVLSMLVTLRT